MLVGWVETQRWSKAGAIRGRAFSGSSFPIGEWCVFKDAPYEITILQLTSNSTVLGLDPAYQA